MVKKKVLIVDDEPALTNLVCLILEQTGEFEVMPENNAAHALDAAVKFKPDLILLDVIMPDMEGPDVAMALQRNEKTRGMKIAFLTATVTKPQSGSGTTELYDLPCLAKPAGADELIKFINGVISGNIKSGGTHA